MAIELKFNTDRVYNQFQKYIVDGVEYIFHLYWNDRGTGSWYIGIYDAEKFSDEKEDNSEALLIGGRKLMPMQNVLYGLYYMEGLPKGMLLVADSEEKFDYEILNTSNFGTGKRYQLWYYSVSELRQRISQ